MKMVEKIVVIALFTLVYGVCDAKVYFEKNSHDFGSIAEDGGEVEHIFRLRNHSSKPVVVVAAHSSCGCTKAEFSRKPLMPDSVASIKVRFNPLNYPGAFARKVTIVTNDGALDERILITGTVIPRKKSIEEEYPIVLGGGVRVATNAHSFGFFEHGKSKQSTFDIVNTSQRKVLLALENPYEEIEFFLPTEVAPGEKISLNFVCSLPDDSAKYGSLSYSVRLVIDGQRAQYPFIINGMAIDSRKENANNPTQMIVLSENFIKFGAVNCGSREVVREIEVSNCGSEPLMIRRLELNSDGFSANLMGDSTIKQGEKRKIAVKVKPSHLPFGAVVEKLHIVSNDPKRPVYTIRVSAIVER